MCSIVHFNLQSWLFYVMMLHKVALRNLSISVISRPINVQKKWNKVKTQITRLSAAFATDNLAAAAPDNLPLSSVHRRRGRVDNHVALRSVMWHREARAEPPGQLAAARRGRGVLPSGADAEWMLLICQYDRFVRVRRFIVDLTLRADFQDTGSQELLHKTNCLAPVLVVICCKYTRWINYIFEIICYTIMT